jgi:hypothetical protein
VAGEGRVQSLVRISTVNGADGARLRKRVPAWFSGQAPLYFVAWVSGGLLWGTGHNLPSVAGLGGTDLRTGVAWLAFVAALLAVAYPLLSMAAELIRGSRPKRLFTRGRVNRQRRRRQKLIAAYRELQPRCDIAATEVALRFPLSDAALRRTALGNAEAAVADRIARRYHGLDLELAWPRLTPLILENDQKSLATTLAAAEYRADAALFSAAGWLVVTVWILPWIWVVSQFAMTGTFRLWAPPFFFAASVAVTLFSYSNRYREAVDRTIARGKLVESAVDFYRLDLLNQLGFRRPKPGEEPQVFAALSAYLAGHTVEKRFLRDDVAVEGSIQALESSILGTVKRGIDESMRRTLAGPELENYDGHLSVKVLDDGAAVPVSGDSTAGLIPGHGYTLVVSIASNPQLDAATAPIRIRGGNDGPVVPFAVSIDSNVPDLCVTERPFPVQREASRPPLEVPFRMERNSNASRWVWIRVTQHGRTIQNLDLELAGEGGHP